MTAIVFYASRTGNTQRVAEAIADGLGGRVKVDVRAIDAGPADVPDDAELVVIGGPTEAHGVTDEVDRFIAALPHGCLHDRFAAAFDTRVRWPRWLSGSAAEGIRGRLEASGARQPVASQSFLVSMKPEIEPDELSRARAWGAELASSLEAGAVVGAAGA
jgi:flavodoxin